jgi:hypothetical protein
MYFLPVDVGFFLVGVFIEEGFQGCSRCFFFLRPPSRGRRERIWLLVLERVFLAFVGRAIFRWFFFNEILWPSGCRGKKF